MRPEPLDGTYGHLRSLTRPEFDVLVEWAAAEGWNPGRHDAECFWATDPEGFVGVEVDGQLAAGGSIVSYERRYGFMGFFIVRSDLRGRGIGRSLWHERKRILLSRLEPGAPIGMDGVFAMEPFYARGGFVREHRELRFEAPPERSRSPQPTHSPSEAAPDRVIVPACDIPLQRLTAFDSRHFPAPRPDFIRRWIAMPGALALAALSGGLLSGLAVARPAMRGMRVGPLFADAPGLAEDLLARILDDCAGEPVQIDVPERNAEAMRLAAQYGMREVFGCAKMTFGKPPDLPWDRIYGVTSLELG